MIEMQGYKQWTNRISTRGTHGVFGTARPDEPQDTFSLSLWRAFRMDRDALVAVMPLELA
jgi:hypothetical protein